MMAIDGTTLQRRLNGTPASRHHMLRAWAVEHVSVNNFVCGRTIGKKETD
jgi:hypothetical protein